MKFAAICLLCTLASAVSGASVVRDFDHGKVIRLPLPEAIKQIHPELVDEPLNGDSVDTKVVGGTNAPAGLAPHQIALFGSNSFTCGGSLVSSNAVLTAAHCVYGSESNPSKYKIRYSTIDRTSGLDIAVKTINRHASYNPNTIDYDVAVLTLSSSFTPSSNAKVISLSTSEPTSGSVLLTGWGRLSSGGSLPTILQQATLSIVTRSKCQSLWGSVNSITNRMICAHNSKQSACNGDSGGPLVLGGKLVGVVSWGSSSCLHATLPTIYGNVANLYSWISARI